MNILISILFARYLGAKSLGQYTLGISIIGLIGIFTNGGILTIMKREISKSGSKTKLYLGNALGIKLLISFPLLLFISTICTKFIFKYSGDTIYSILLMTIYLTFISSISYIGSAFVSLHRNDILLKINIINKFISLLGTLVILSHGFSLVDLLYFYILISILVFIYSMFQVRKIIPEFKIIFNKRFNKTYIILSIPLVMAAAAEFISLKIDTVFIGTMMSEISVGYYTASYNMFMGAFLFPLALTKVYFPNFISYYQSDEKKAFHLLYKYNTLFICYAIIVSIFFYYLAEDLINIIYGDSFKDSVEILRYFSIGLIFIILNRLYNYTLLAIKQNNYYFKITVFGMMINLTLNYILILKFGLLGAVYATIVTEFVVMILGYSKIYIIRKSIIN